VPVLQATATGVLLRVRVQPRARTEQLQGVQEGRLRVRLTAPPVDGAANQACVALIAKALGISRTQVRLHAGEKSREKMLHLIGVTATQVATALGITLE
jgi:uncharacterized protein